MNFSFITKSDDQLHLMLRQVNSFIQKDDSPELRTIRDNLTECIESLRVFRQEKRLNVDVLRMIQENNKDEINNLFSSFSFTETTCSLSIREESGRNRLDWKYRNIFNQKCSKDIFKKQKIGFSSYKNIFLSSSGIISIKVSIPKNITEEIFMEKLRSLADGIVPYVNEIIETVPQHKTLFERVTRCIPGNRANISKGRGYLVELIKKNLYKITYREESLIIEGLKSGYKTYIEENPKVYQMGREYKWNELLNHLEEEAERQMK